MNIDFSVHTSKKVKISGLERIKVQVPYDEEGKINNLKRDIIALKIFTNPIPGTDFIASEICNLVQKGSKWVYSDDKRSQMQKILHSFGVSSPEDLIGKEAVTLAKGFNNQFLGFAY